MTPKRPFAFVAGLALAASLLLGIPGSPAGAAVGDLTCTTEQRTTYSPGVTLFPAMQKITLDTLVAPCVSLSNPNITSGAATFTVQGIRSCLTLDQSSSGTSGIKWNTGQTSTYTYTSSSKTVLGQIVVTITGTVTAGVFQGTPISLALVSPVVNVTKCLIPPGITSRVGVGTLVIG
jgi:hypothetical protein